MRFSLHTYHFAIFAFLLFFPVFSLASNYSVSPLVIDHELEKRDIIKEVITITNNDSRMVRIFPTVNEIGVNAGGGIESFIEPSMVDRPSSVTSWLEIGRGRIELMPGESKEVTLTIRVNPEVQSGEYHAFVGFPEGSNRPNAEKRVLMGNAPGTVVRIGVDKVQNQFLRLEKFTVERFVKDTTEGDVQYTLVNPGNDPVTPKGEIIFYNNSGAEVGSIPVNEEGTSIEGGQTLTFQSEVPEDMAMGKHKAFLSVEYGDHQTASVQDTAFFYVLPLTYILAIFFAVLVFSVVLALYVHKRYDKEEVVDADDVALFIREGRSESKDHDIDLSQKK